MKKTLFLALALMIGLAACQTQTQQTAGTETPGDAAGSGISSLTGEIVYVRMDSLMSGYTFYKLLNDSLEQRSLQVENDLTSRGRSLETNMRNAQNKVQNGLVTSTQARELEQQLMQQEQDLMSRRDQLLGELSELEQVTMNRITNVSCEGVRRSILVRLFRGKRNRGGIRFVANPVARCRISGSWRVKRRWILLCRFKPSAFFGENVQ